jgi:hypothetical protein
MSAYAIPEVLTPEAVAQNEVTLAANGDLRQSANEVCGAAQVPARTEESFAAKPTGYQERRSS